MRLMDERGLKIATAESCTGGQLSSLLTDIEGLSHCVEGAFVAYSVRAKIEMLRVPSNVLERNGAVSAATAAEMANGALRVSSADLAVAVTGFAGPAGPGDTPGLVYLALADRWGASRSVSRKYPDTSRESVRRMAIDDALHMALAYLLGPKGSSGAPEPSFSGHGTPRLRN